MKKVISALAAILVTGFVPVIAHGAVTSTFYGVGISRADFVVMAMQRRGGVTDGTFCFTDVANQSYAPSVCAAKQLGIVTGMPNGRFLPNQSISFIEAAAIALRAEGAGVRNGSPWYVPYLEKIGDWNALPDSIDNILDPLSYAQAQDLISNVMNHGSDDNVDDNDNNDDLDLSVTVSDSTVDPGDTVTFRIKLKNTANDDLENIDVNAELDSDMEYVSSTDDGDENDDEVDWDNIDVDEDDTKTILLTVRIDDDVDENDTLRLKVEAEGETVTRSISVEDDNNKDGDLKLSITDSDNVVEQGDTITYTIRLENTDNNYIRVDVNAELDDDVDFISASDGGDESRNEVEWNDIRLNEDQVKTLTLRVRVKSSAHDGQKLELRVTANDEEETETTEVDDNNNDNEDINVSITDSDDPAQEGDTVIYRITLENNENDDVTVDVTAQLDDGMSFLDASHNGDHHGDEVQWDNIAINEDGERVLTLTVRINSEADDGDTLELKVEAGDGEDTEETDIEN